MEFNFSEIKVKLTFLAVAILVFVLTFFFLRNSDGLGGNLRSLNGSSDSSIEIEKIVVDDEIIFITDGVPTDSPYTAINENQELMDLSICHEILDADLDSIEIFLVGEAGPLKGEQAKAVLETRWNTYCPDIEL